MSRERTLTLRSLCPLSPTEPRLVVSNLADVDASLVLFLALDRWENSSPNPEAPN